MRAIARLFTALGVVALIGGLAYFGGRYWQNQDVFVTTENAYVKSEITSIAARVSGYAVEIFVEENQSVEAKQPLFRIDPRDFRAELEEAEAQIETQNAALTNLAARRVLQEARISAARSTLEARQAEADFAGAELVRASTLRESGTGTQQRLDDALSADLVARARVAEAEATLRLETAQTSVLDAEETSIRASLSAAVAARDTKKIALEDTLVWAPAAGVIARRRTRVGEYLPAGVETMALVPDDALWIEANIRETQAARLVPGDRAEVRVDMLDDAVACATIESISPAAGSEFALLPPDNATGNFTKIVRRFPVRLRFDEDDPLLGRIRAGMSVVPRIAIGSHRTGRAEDGILGFLGGPGFACDAAGPVPPPEPINRSLPEHPGLARE